MLLDDLITLHRAHRALLPRENTTLGARLKIAGAYHPDARQEN
jgi:hypothetical protein